MNTTTDRTGKWYLTPAGKNDPYVAGWDCNVFESEEEAEAAIPSLREAGPDFDHDWVTRQYG